MTDKQTENLVAEPIGKLAIRILAMPKDTNVNGDIFGGWIVSLMDLGASISAKETCKGRCVTVAIDKMIFLHPVHVGDTVCCYTDMLKIGNTSMTIRVQVWAVGIESEDRVKVTEGVFTFVAVDEQGRPRPVQKKVTTEVKP
jgi:acyl-CoA thioesterase YciA